MIRIFYLILDFSKETHLREINGTALGALTYWEALTIHSIEQKKPASSCYWRCLFN